MGQTRYLSKSWVFKGRFSFKLRQHGQQLLYLQYKAWWILYKMVGPLSFLYIQSTLQYPPKNSSSTSVSFCIPIPLLLFHKIILTTPLLTLSVSISQQFFTSLFLCTTIPTICIKNIFPTSTILPIQAASRDQVARDSCEEWNCFNLFLLLQSMDSDNRAHNQSQKTGVLQVWQIIQFTFSHALNLFPWLSYPTDTTKRTHITLETSCLTWLLNFILSLAFSGTNHAPFQPYV